MYLGLKIGTGDGDGVDHPWQMVMLYAYIYTRIHRDLRSG